MSLSIRPAVTAWSDAQLLIMVCIVALRHEHVILYEFTWLIPYHDIDLISNIRSNPSRRQQCWESRIHDTHLVHRFENYCKELSTVELSCRLLIVGTMQQMALIAILIRSSPLHPPSLSNLHISFPLSLSLDPFSLNFWLSDNELKHIHSLLTWFYAHGGHRIEKSGKSGNNF